MFRGCSAILRSAWPPHASSCSPPSRSSSHGGPRSAEYHRIKALGELGHRVDLVTYPFGRDVDLPNLRIVRSRRPPFLRGVRIGPSFAKIVLDVFLAATAIGLARRTRYDAIHSHEEAGLLGVWLARRHGVPHLYDMHSSLPQQLANFRYSRSALIRRVFERVEDSMIGNSSVIITICQELQDAVEAAGAGSRSFLIENVMGGDVDPDLLGTAEPFDVRDRYGIPTEDPIVLYTGTFEQYQGLDLLMDVAARLASTHPRAWLVIVGGEPAQVDAVRARLAGRAERVVFTGQRPPTEIPTFIDAAQVLVSPRISGTNTPLKIYSYLRSGVPIVATDLRTHTQVLDPDVACLVPPEAMAFASAVGRLLDDPVERDALATAARRLATTRYGREAYVAKTAAAYERLLPGGGTERAAGGDPVLRAPRVS